MDALMAGKGRGISKVNLLLALNCIYSNKVYIQYYVLYKDPVKYLLSIKRTCYIIVSSYNAQQLLEKVMSKIKQMKALLSCSSLYIVLGALCVFIVTIVLLVVFIFKIR